jgi:MFS family permease
VSGADRPVAAALEQRGRFIALRSRDFRLLLTGQAVSLTGSFMQQVAVAWQLYLLTRSPLALGLLGFFRVAPVVAFALGGGVIADAVDRRRLMLCSQSALALVSLALALATHFGKVSPGVIYAMAFLAGTATVFDLPARQALVPALVSREELPNALSLYATMMQVGSVVGPALGGAVLAWRGPKAIYCLDAVSYLAVIGALVSLRHRAPGRGLAQVNARAALEGLRFIWRTPLISSTMLLDFIATFLGGSMLLLPIFADQLLHVGPRGLGLLYAAQPVGACLTGAALSTLPPIKRRGEAVLVSVAIYGLAIAVFGISPWFSLSFLALAVSGAADTVSMVVRQTLRQLLTPDELRGRMTSINMIFFMGGPQLGEVEAGAVARAFSPRISVASGGLLCALAVGAVALAVPSLRSYRVD